MSGLFGAGSKVSKAAPEASSLRVTTSCYGRPIPLGWGRFKVAGFLLDYDDFEAIAHEQSQGGKGGDGYTSTSYTYQAAVILGITEVPINDVVTAWKGKERYTSTASSTKTYSKTETAYIPFVTGVFTVDAPATIAAVQLVRANWSQGFDRYDLVLGTDYTRSGNTFTVLNQTLWGETVQVTYTYSQTTAPTTPLGSIGLSLFKGTLTQTPWSHMTTNHPAKALGYRGIAYAAGATYDLGTSPSLPNTSFEVDSGSGFSLTVRDVVPSTVIVDYLTNPQYGAYFPARMLGDLTDYANYCIASNLLLSPEYTEQAPASETLSRIAMLTNSDWTLRNGRLTIVPYADQSVTGNGKTWNPNLTAIYALTEVDFGDVGGGEQIIIKRKDPTERYNHVKVKYRNRDKDYNDEIAEGKDEAEIARNGMRSPPQEIELPEVKTQTVATNVANLIVQRAVNVCLTYTFVLKRNKVGLEPMDLVTLTHSGYFLSGQLVRIIEIAEQEDGTLLVDAEEVPVGTASSILYGIEVASGNLINFNEAPGNAGTPIIFEVPVDRTTRTGLALYIAVPRGASAAWGGANIWVSLDGMNYKMAGTVFGGARVGALSAASAAGATSFAVDGLGTEQLLSGSAADAAALETLCFINGTNKEYFAYQTATVTGAGAYTLSALVRGAFGTSLLAHSNNDQFVRVDNRVVKSEDLDTSLIGDVVYVKVCSFNRYQGALQTLADVAATTYTIAGYMASIPPANVAGLTATAIPGFIRLKWTQNNEKDVSAGAIELRLGTVWTSGVRLEDGTAGSTSAAGNSYDWAWPAVGSYTVLARHRDTLGNLSTATASVTFDVTATSIKITATELDVSLGGGNIVPNSSFESDVNADNVPDKWINTSFGSGITIVRALINTIKTHAEKSFRLTVSAVTAPVSSLHTVLMDLAECPLVLEDKPYVVSCDVRTTNINLRARIGMNWYDSTDTVISSNTLAALAVHSGASIWERLVSAPVFAPAGAVKGRPYIGIQRPSTGDTTLGSVYFDAFQVQIGDKATSYAPKPDEILPRSIGTTEVAIEAMTETPRLEVNSDVYNYPSAVGVQDRKFTSVNVTNPTDVSVTVEVSVSGARKYQTPAGLSGTADLNVFISVTKGPNNTGLLVSTPSEFLPNIIENQAAGVTQQVFESLTFAVDIPAGATWSFTPFARSLSNVGSTGTITLTTEGWSMRLAVIKR